MTFESYVTRINAQIEHDFPGIPPVLWVQDRSAATAVSKGYGFTREAGIATPIGQDVAVDGRGKIVIFVSLTFVGLRDHEALHELAHGIESWFNSDDYRSRPYGSVYAYPQNVWPLAYREDAIQERVWASRGCEGHYVDWLFPGVHHNEDAKEWWAEVIATLYDRTGEPFDTRQSVLHGGSAPIPGLYVMAR